MPLLVHCPQGCQIRIPVNRAGRVVRCSQCKSPIRVARIDAQRLASGAVIECDAKLVKPKPRVDVGPATAEPQDSPAASPSPDRLPTLPVPAEPKLAARATIDASSKAALAADALATEVSQEKPSPQLPSQGPPPLELPPQSTIDSASLAIKPLKPNATQWKAPRSSKADAGPQLDSNGAPRINLDFSESGPEADVEPKSWQERLEDANQDRVLLTRILAVGLCLLAIVNVGPAIVYWQSWASQTDAAILPRWLYWQVFVGAICLVYALFLFQIPDWSALRAVSVAMLILAFTFGAISTGLLVGGDGMVAGMLGIPFSLNRQACIWCVAMLCLSTLMSYWAGKESWNWQRAESLLQGILSRSAG